MPFVNLALTLQVLGKTPLQNRCRDLTWVPVPAAFLLRLWRRQLGRRRKLDLQGWRSELMPRWRHWLGRRLGRLDGRLVERLQGLAVDAFREQTPALIGRRLRLREARLPDRLQHE